MATIFSVDELRTMFQSSFSMQTWYNCLQYLFNASELKVTPEKINNQTLENGYYLGNIDTVDSYRIGLFYFKITHGSVEKRKIGLRNFVRSYINASSGQFDAALVVFDSGDLWRLSFICDIKGEATSPKRYTYVFGNQGILYRTPIERFRFLQNKGVSFENFKTAFSVEALSDEFFNRYREQYADFIQYITGKRFIKVGSKWEEKVVGESNAVLMFAFNFEEKVIRNYIKKMMGRLTFLHFLQRKGWLCGDLNYLQNLFERSPYQDDYLDSVLEPLFFGILNTKPEQRKQVFEHYNWDLALLKEWESIPYLNGGLFERDKEDEPESKFPADYFKRLFQFFSEYNFTIDENDPNDAEVGVDPEMLGKIFENLLEDNKDKGAFYTPKEIVRYMCQESLIAYLETNTSIAKEKIRQFVLSPDENVAEIPENKKPKLLDALKEVKICDPAIGSGAFPMGLLNELLSCREALEHMDVPRSEIKKSIIQNNIYGVDIEKGAVDIARLRFWLSIVVDEEKASPLPNLDYKIMQGNSLVESFMGVDLNNLSYKTTSKKDDTDNGLFDDEKVLLQKQVSRLLTKYYSCSDHDEKKTIQQEIQVAINKQLEVQSFDPLILKILKDVNLAGNSQFFLWHTWFSEVFNRPDGKSGFDIVIGNPPYVSRLDNEMKKLLGEQYPEAKKKIFDLYNFFMVFSTQILTKGTGVSSLIVPPTWLNNKNNSTLRRYMAKNGLCRVDFLGDKVFDAVVYSCIYLTSYSSTQVDCFDTQLVNGILRQEHRNTIDIQHVIKTGDYISLAHNSSILSKCHNPDKFISLGNISNIVFGIQDRKSAKDPSYIHTDIINKNCKKALNGKHINRYSIMDSGLYIEYGEWLWNPRRREIFESSEKILVRQVGKYPICAYDNENYYTLNTIYNIIIENDKFLTKYVLGVLNSKIMQVIWKEIYPEEKDVFPRLKKEQLVEIPIPIVNIEVQSQISRIVDLIVTNKKITPNLDTYNLENQIDKLVYQLYGLNDTEIKIIEESV